MDLGILAKHHNTFAVESPKQEKKHTRLDLLLLPHPMELETR
jgi:hypothetical protein